jgi:hypothetical protein
MCDVLYWKLKIIIQNKRFSPWVGDCKDESYWKISTARALIYEHCVVNAILRKTQFTLFMVFNVTYIGAMLRCCNISTWFTIILIHILCYIWCKSQGATIKWSMILQQRSLLAWKEIEHGFNCDPSYKVQTCSQTKKKKGWGVVSIWLERQRLL